MFSTFSAFELVKSLLIKNKVLPVVVEKVWVNFISNFKVLSSIVFPSISKDSGGMFEKKM